MNSEKIRIILASKSPRRKELLENAGFEIVIIPSEAEENIDEKDPAEMVKKLSYIKANSVYDNIANIEGEIDSSYAINTRKTAESCITDKKDDSKAIIVLGADTVVYAGGMILGKPKNKEDVSSNQSFSVLNTLRQLVKKQARLKTSLMKHLFQPSVKK